MFNNPWMHGQCEKIDEKSRTPEKECKEHCERLGNCSGVYWSGKIYNGYCKWWSCVKDPLLDPEKTHGYDYKTYVNPNAK